MFTSALLHTRHRILLAITLLLAIASPVQAQRVALLVGNADYTVGRLNNPPHDVTVMENALVALGFRIQKILNANQNQMKRALRDFGTAAQGAEVAFVYYSGHGTQINGENYLLPVGAMIDKEGDYDVEAVSANTVLRQIQGARPKTAILVFDACRDNPLASTTRSGSKGLGRMEAPTGTMIAFATAPNTVASDNGHYARVLAKELQRHGQDLVDVFRNTAAEVKRLSNGSQDPRISEVSINEKIYLATAPSVVPSQQPQVDVNSRIVAVDPDYETWELTKRRDSIQSYQAYLSAFPQGKYAFVARTALEGLQPQRQVPKPVENSSSNNRIESPAPRELGGNKPALTTEEWRAMDAASNSSHQPIMVTSRIDAGRERSAETRPSNSSDNPSYRTYLKTSCSSFHWNIQLLDGGRMCLNDIAKGISPVGQSSELINFIPNTGRYVIVGSSNHQICGGLVSYASAPHQNSVMPKSVDELVTEATRVCKSEISAKISSQCDCKLIINSGTAMISGDELLRVFRK